VNEILLAPLIHPSINVVAYATAKPAAADLSGALALEELIIDAGTVTGLSGLSALPALRLLALVVDSIDWDTDEHGDLFTGLTELHPPRRAQGLTRAPSAPRPGRCGVALEADVPRHLSHGLRFPLLPHPPRDGPGACRCQQARLIGPSLPALRQPGPGPSRSPA